MEEQSNDLVAWIIGFFAIISTAAGTAIGLWFKFKADARAARADLVKIKADEARTEAESIAAQAKQEQRDTDYLIKRWSDLVDRNERQIKEIREYLFQLQEKESKCREEMATLRAENGFLLNRIASLEQRISTLEGQQ